MVKNINVSWIRFEARLYGLRGPEIRLTGVQISPQQVLAAWSWASYFSSDMEPVICRMGRIMELIYRYTLRVK